MTNIFKPDEVQNRVVNINLEKIKEMGKECFLLDFDNTLGPDHSTEPTQYSVEFINKLKEYGFTCCLVSNAKTGRSAGIAKALGIPCVTYAHKPRPDGINRAIKLMNTSKEKCVMVGDQIFTDVIAGKLAHVYTILVERYSKKEIWYVKLKRPLESIVRFFGRY